MLPSSIDYSSIKDEEFRRRIQEIKIDPNRTGIDLMGVNRAIKKLSDPNIRFEDPAYRGAIETLVRAGFPGVTNVHSLAQRICSNRTMLTHEQLLQEIETFKTSESKPNPAPSAPKATADRFPAVLKKVLASLTAATKKQSTKSAAPVQPTATTVTKEFSPAQLAIIKEELEKIEDLYYRAEILKIAKNINLPVGLEGAALREGIKGKVAEFNKNIADRSRQPVPVVQSLVAVEKMAGEIVSNAYNNAGKISMSNQKPQWVRVRPSEKQALPQQETTENKGIRKISVGPHP